MTTTSHYLKKLTSVTLPKTDGVRTIAKEKKLFSYIDSDFEDWGMDKIASEKPETPVEVFEMTKDGTFESIYGSISKDLDSLCLTQEQIITFVEKHRDLLRDDGYATFFLFKSGSEFFVASVYFYSVARLVVYVRGLGNVVVWYAEARRRFVFPQLQDAKTLGSPESLTLYSLNLRLEKLEKLFNKELL